MAVTLSRQLDDVEKIQVLGQHGRVCFATGHPIPEDETVQFDHIRAFAMGGATEVNNIAPMCPQHNREKGSLPLFDFRAKLRIEDFFKGGDKLTLGHLLEYLRAKGDISVYGQAVSVQDNGLTITLSSANRSVDAQVYRCPITGWDYFYATLPVDILGSDDDHDQATGLQPRYLIFDKVFELFRHFQTRPVLQPSLGRILDSRIRLFDGQHKAAALLWNGLRDVECKIYVNPDARVLNQTNISAHEKFAQTRFYSSIMVQKLGAQFGVDFEDYKNLENGQTKNESGFVRHLALKDSLKPGDVSKMFRSFLYHSILDDKENRLERLVSRGNRATDEKPLTLNGLTDSLFSSFLYRQPVDDNMTTDAYKRGSETENMVKLLNMLDEMGFHRWNPKASKSDDSQLKLRRMSRTRFMKAWAELLKDSICAKLSLYDSDEKARPFYRELSKADLREIRLAVSRLFEWKLWSSPEGSDIDQTRTDSDGMVKDWVRQNGLTTGYLMGAPQ